MAFETRERRAARKARAQARYVELEVATLEEIAKVDPYSRRDGEPVSSFGRALEDAFVRLGLPPEEVLGSSSALAIRGVGELATDLSLVRTEWRIRLVSLELVQSGEGS